MSLRYCEGFDPYNNTAQAQHVDSQGSVSLITGRGGVGNALRFTAPNIFRTYVVPGFVGTRVIAQFGFRRSAASLDNNGNAGVIRFETASGVAIATLTILATGAFRWRSGSGLGTVRFDSDAGLSPVDTWHALKLDFTQATGATGSLSISVNGVEVVSATGIITAATTNPLGAFSLRPWETGNFDYDDIVIVDQSSPGITGIVGDRRVGASYAVADTAAADFTPSSGTDGFAMIDETTPNEDTDYIHSNVPGHRSLFKFTAPTDKIIEGARVMLRARKEDAGSGNLKAVFKGGLGAEIDSGELGIGLSYLYHNFYVQVNPDDDSLLTTASFEAAEIGVEAA